jgi:hypothetical protein
MSAFSDKARSAAYPFQFKGELVVGTLVGGVPSNDKVAEGWIRTKMGQDSDSAIQQLVAQTMVDRGITDPEEAIKIANEYQNLNGFKRTAEGKLYIEGRQLKAALKEAINVSVAAGKLNGRGWGKTNKGILSYFAEHVFVVEEKLLLGVTEPSGVHQRFVHTFRGTGIQYEEYVEDAKISFTVISDHDFSTSDWETIWLTGEHQGLGATRSQGFGTYQVETWEQTPESVKLVEALKKKAAKAAAN